MPPRPRGWLASAVAFIVAIGCQSPEALDQPDSVTAELKGNNVGGHNVGGHNVGGHNVGGHNVGGHNVGGHNVGGHNVGGHNVGGHNVGGHNVGGHNVGGHNVGGHNVGGHNVGGTRHNVGGHNVGGHNVGGHNVGGHNVGGHNIAGANLSGRNLIGESVSGRQLDWAAVEAPNVTRSSGSDTLRVSGPVSKLLHSGEDVLPRSARCIVMGVGTTEFARLLAQQSANSQLRTTIGKLPWGFSDRAGGPIELNAWEAVVRGDKTHCSFVLATPTDVTWTGVAGFMKAIFRWNAPLTQSMEISGFPASALYDPSYVDGVTTYTGMMDAGEQWRSGRITERSLVAGELAFVAATTNNQTVMVDFASWVIDAGGSGLVLGHVEKVSPPRYAESVYYAYEADDGSIGLAVGPASWASERGAYFDRMASSYESLDAAYRLHQEGLFPKPIPTRCGGTLFLNARYHEPVAPGKCDSDVLWTVGTVSGQRSWETVHGSTAPMNQYMLLPASETTPLRRDGKIVLSETYIHMWDVNYVYGPESTSLPQDLGRFIPGVQEQQARALEVR